MFDPFEALTPSSEEQDAKQAAWMISFADLLSVILTFFILLYSMVDLSPKNWGPIADSLSQRMQIPVNPSQAVETSNTPVQLAGNQVLDTGYLYHILDNKLHAHPELGGIA